MRDAFGVGMWVLHLSDGVGSQLYIWGRVCGGLSGDVGFVRGGMVGGVVAA